MMDAKNYSIDFGTCKDPTRFPSRRNEEFGGGGYLAKQKFKFI